MNKKNILLIRISILLFSILVVLYIVDIKELVASFGKVPIWLLGFGVLLTVFRTWLTGLRWKLVNPDVAEQLSRWQYFKYLMIANTFNLFMPGALGGDFVKTAIIVKSVNINRVENIIAIFADRIIGLLSIILLALVSLGFATDIENRYFFIRFITTLLAVFIGSVLFASNGIVHKLGEWIFSKIGKAGIILQNILEKWQKSLLFFRKNYLRVITAFMLSVPIHFSSFFIAYMVARHLQIDIGFFDISMIMALVWVITAVPITISGAGVREISFVYFLSKYGVEASPAASLSMHLYLIMVFVGLLGFVFIFINKKKDMI